MGMTTTQCESWISQQAMIAAREAGRRSPTKLAAAWAIHKSCASRDMNGEAGGTNRIRNFLRGIHLLAAHPDTDAWPVLVRGRIVIHRIQIQDADTMLLRRRFWELRGLAYAAQNDVRAADERRDVGGYADALASAQSINDELAAHAQELAGRGVNPLEEGRP